MRIVRLKLDQLPLDRPSMLDGGFEIGDSVRGLGGGCLEDPMSNVVQLCKYRQGSKQVCFDRHELNRLLSLYSRRVSGGEWKDYAIGHGDGMAAFSVFRNASDRPLFTVIKYAPGTHRNGDYVLCSGRRRIKRGSTLGEILASFERPLGLVVS